MIFALWLSYFILILSNLIIIRHQLVCLQLKLIISRTIFTIMIDKMPFDFIRHKSKAAPKRTHSKILVARRYMFQKQPRIIKHNCLFHTFFIKLFVTFLLKQLLSFLIVNYQSFL